MKSPHPLPFPRYGGNKNPCPYLERGWGEEAFSQFVLLNHFLQLGTQT
jgi:hypothetical protein